MYLMIFLSVCLTNLGNSTASMSSREEHDHLGVSQQALEMDSGEKRLNELGYKQELRREMVIWIKLSFS